MHGLSVAMAVTGSVPDQQAYVPTGFYQGIHGNHFVSNISGYAARTESMPMMLHDAFESSPIPFAPGLKEEEDC